MEFWVENQKMGVHPVKTDRWETVQFRFHLTPKPQRVRFVFSNNYGSFPGEDRNLYISDSVVWIEE
jgi:hypothetical protein